MDKIVADVKRTKTLSGGSPYYVLGPLVTDTATGCDHIAAAIGATIAAAGQISYVTLPQLSTLGCLTLIR
ncbi:MAG: phosphomethylpyrimidine synthase ThiC [Desulfurococcaceae archaeon]